MPNDLPNDQRLLAELDATCHPNAADIRISSRIAGFCLTSQREESLRASLTYVNSRATISQREGENRRFIPAPRQMRLSRV